jgi:37-kD nucleoid-associated bacterial protein
MIEFSEVSLNKIIIHRVGNKSLDEGYKFSDNALPLNPQDDLTRLLTGFFLKPFENVPLYNFTHVTSLELNEIYSIATKIFASPKGLIKESKEIGKILYEYSTHPKIKNGEMYVVYFKNCTFENREVDAIGIFKSENKETFLKLKFDGSDYQVEPEDGISINKLDKGCLILNVQKDEGYVVAVVDTISRGTEAQYWKDEFLKIRPANDNYHSTQHYLDACKNFVTTQLEQEYEVNKTDKISYLNKTVDYFKNNAAFDEGDFLQEVFEDREVIKSFRNFKEEYAAESGVDLEDSFEISGMAVKKQARVFKSVLKLDKNFHVYIHGDKSLIEKGYDAKVGKSFYKIYFDEES